MTERVLVAGGSGFLGGGLVSRLARDGWSHAAVSRSAGIDLTRGEQVQTLTGFDVIVNACGRTSVPASYRDPAGFHRDNILTTLNLLDVARRTGARFVHAGSYVYGTPRSLPIDETHPVAAQNPYAASKVAAERLCADYHRDFGVPVTVLRIFNAYGPGQRAEFLVPTIVAGVLAGAVEVADGTPRRDFVHREDVVEALVRAISWRHAGCEAINVGSGRSTSVAELIGIAVRASGRDVRVRIREVVRPAEIPDTVADIRKAAVTLGWTPRIDLEDGIAALVRSSGEDA